MIDGPVTDSAEVDQRYVVCVRVGPARQHEHSISKSVSDVFRILERGSRHRRRQGWVGAGGGFPSLWRRG